MDSSNISNGSSLDQMLLDAKLHRHVNALIVAHLRDNNLNQAARVVASATMIPLTVETPPIRLLQLVAKGLAAEKDELLRRVSSAAAIDPTLAAGYGSIPAPLAISVDFRVLTGTDHSIPHLYDINTFQCYVPLHFQDIIVNGAINQVRYSRNGSMFVTASKDGAIRLWDGVTANCVRSIDGAHGTEEATSANFTKDQRYILSCGKDSSVKLWEVGTGKLVKQYLGAVHTKLQFQAVFNDTEEFVLSIDESSNEIVVWDALTTKNVGRLPSNHIDVPRWIEHSPTEAAFVSCGIDQSVQFWREKRSSLGVMYGY
nr:cleavage stimulation factor subunit 50 isoform X2 [Ipomoea batatas]